MCVSRGIAPGTGSSVVYTVPQGFGLILKSVGIQPQTGVAYSVTGYMEASGGSVGTVLFQQSPAANVSYWWEGWLVLNGGDTFNLIAASSAVSYWISGALLPFAP